jgi:hypothetical protein
MGASDGSSYQAVNDCSTSIALSETQAQRPELQELSSPKGCGLISITVIAPGRSLAASNYISTTD